MPAINTGGAKVKRGKRAKVKHQPKVRVSVPTPDQADRARAAQPPPTPDQADRTRTPRQKTKDAAVVKRNVQSSRVKAVREQHRGAGTRAVKHAVHVIIHTNAQARPAVVSVPVVTNQGGKIKVTAVKPDRELDPSSRRVQAPVIKVLDQTTRPLHGVAAAAKANVHAIKTKGLKPRPFYLQAKPRTTLKAAAKGVENKDKSTFSDVLTEAGWNPRSRLGKLAKGATGLTGDVVFDPTTYVTGGSGKIATKTAEEAATRAAAKTAAKASRPARAVTKKEARRAEARAKGGGASAPSLPDRAHARAEKTGDQTKGIVVRFAGAEVPGVRKATAHASKPVRKVARKATPSRVREGARAVGADLNPNVAPVGVARETSDAAIRATRTARSKANRGTHEAQQRALGIRKVIGEENYQRVIDAIESGTIGKLPAELRGTRENPGPAIILRDLFRHARHVERRAGIPVGEIKHRAQVKVPEVTADTKESAKSVGKARRAEAAAERALHSAQARHNVYQGRAEVLSRNVSGVRAEKAAERGRNTAQARKGREAAARTKRRALGKGLTPMQAQSAANRVAAAVRVPAYAGGGKGVEDTTSAVKVAEQRLRDAVKAHEAARASHAQTIGDAAAQRAARKQAEEINAKRAVAPKGYIPHQLTDEAAAASGRSARGPGRRVIRPSSSMARTDNRPLSALRAESPGKYSEDLPNLFAARKASGTTAVARAELNRRIADLGHAVKKGHDVVLNDGESVYHVVGSDIRKVDAKEVTQVIDKGGKKGRYVVLSDEIVKRAVEGVQPHPSEGIVRALDKTQAGFKKIALATPGFHVRNIIGDTQNAYLYQPGHRLPKNLAQAARVLSAEGRGDKALRNLAQPAKGKGTVKTARYGDVTYDDVAKHLTEHGGMRSGYTAREIPELAHQGAKGPRIRVPRKLRQAALNREDLPRVSTALEALKRGATWEEAAQAVSTYHFDYAHLTSFERNVARRGAPFYTFTARNIPLQAKSLVTKPGKYANYQKVREEASKLVQPDQQDPKTRDLYKQLERAGVKLPGGWEKYLSEYEQRNAGVPISWKGQKYTVSLGLPLSDLNELPGFAGGSTGQAREFFNKAASMVTPIVKDPTEIGLNYSFFFRDQVERDNSPLVNAPSFVGKFPDSAKRKLGIVRGQDKRSGEKVWKWPGKVDYIAHTPPGLINAALKLATPGTDRQNRGLGGKALQVAGVRAQPIDATSNVVNLAYARGREIEKRQAKLRQTANPANGQLISAKNPTPEYTRLSQQLKVTKQIEYQGKSSRGDAVLPPQGGPPKGRSSRPRIKLGGGSTGRVKLGGSSTGRVRLGGG